MTRNPRNNCLTLPVLSGSMMPYLCPGGRVGIECAGTDRARLGDIIVFRESDMLVAHRLLFRLRLGRHCYLYQRGDVAGPGGWVKERQVVGVVTTSSSADGAILYVRSTSNAVAHRHLVPFITCAIMIKARSVLRTLIAGGTARR